MLLKEGFFIFLYHVLSSHVTIPNFLSLCVDFFPAPWEQLKLFCRNQKIYKLNPWGHSLGPPRPPAVLLRVPVVPPAVHLLRRLPGKRCVTALVLGHPSTLVEDRVLGFCLQPGTATKTLCWEPAEHIRMSRFKFKFSQFLPNACPGRKQAMAKVLRCLSPMRMGDQG